MKATTIKQAINSAWQTTKRVSNLVWQTVKDETVSIALDVFEFIYEFHEKHTKVAIVIDLAIAIWLCYKLMQLLTFIADFVNYVYWGICC